MPQSAVTSFEALLGLHHAQSAPTLYQYSVLDQSDDIRLLVIDPGQGDDEIACNLSRQNLKNKPTYQALSYTWDNNIPTHGVKILEEILPVTANLYSALERFRNPHRRSTLWVDAVCINQDDVQEREKQVSIMGQIYGTATEVLIWLGDGPENVAEAFDFIRKFEEGLEMYDPKFIQYMHTINAGNFTLWRALSSVFNHPWFTRAWIIQEVVLPAQAQVVCGDQISSWNALTKTVNWIFDNNLGSWIQGLSHLAITRISLIQKLCHQNQGPTDSPMFLLLDLFKYTKSTDPRDKIYALLSLTSDNSYIKPDYTISCEELYASTAIRQLTLDIFYVLCCVDHAVNDSSSCLPSWVPDWAAQNLQSGHRIAFQFLKTWGFKAAVGTQPQWTHSEHNQVLSVTGFVFDTVSRTADHLYDSVQHLSFGMDDYQNKFHHLKTRFQEFDDIYHLIPKISRERNV
ncbi:hypothetical protein MMC12_006384 [Toensbergia leucococca]|nr:hypothetical protein [Toensbergia leucococca]